MITSISIEAVTGGWIVTCRDAKHVFQQWGEVENFLKYRLTDNGLSFK